MPLGFESAHNFFVKAHCDLTAIIPVPYHEILSMKLGLITSHFYFSRLSTQQASLILIKGC